MWEELMSHPLEVLKFVGLIAIVAVIVIPVILRNIERHEFKKSNR